MFSIHAVEEDVDSVTCLWQSLPMWSFATAYALNVLGGFSSPWLTVSTSIAHVGRATLVFSAIDTPRGSAPGVASSFERIVRLLRLLRPRHGIL